MKSSLTYFLNSRYACSDFAIKLLIYYDWYIKTCSICCSYYSYAFCNQVIVCVCVSSQITSQWLSTPCLRGDGALIKGSPTNSSCLDQIRTGLDSVQSCEFEPNRTFLLSYSLAGSDKLFVVQKFRVFSSHFTHL